MSGDFDLSMVITGDASSAASAATQASSALDGVSDAQTRVAKTADDMAASTGAAASGLGKVDDAATETAGATAKLDAAFAALQTELAAARAQAEQAAAGIATLEKANADLVSELQTSQRSIAALAGQVDVLETRLSSASRTHGEAGKSLGNVGIAAAESEHAIRAFADSVNAGQDPVRAFTLELPRLTQAAGFMGGALGAVGEFLSGPWGIALTIGVSVLSPLIEHLLDTPSAAEAAKKALEDVADANRTLASVIDQTNGKISEQNTLLAKAALLSAPQKIAENNKATTTSITDGFTAANKVVDDFSLTGTRAAQAMLGLTTITRDQVRGADDLSDAIKSANGNLGTLTVAVNKLAASNPALAPLRDQLNGYYESAVKSNDATKALIGNQKEAQAALTSQGALTQTVVENQIALATATDAVSKAQAKLNVLRQQESSLFKQPYSDDRNKQIEQVRDQIIAEQKALDAAQAAQHSSRSRTRKPGDPTGTINSLTNEALGDINSYSDAPTFLSKANEELKKLQDGLSKLDEIKPRSPLDVDKIAAAKALLEQAGSVIANNLDKPFRDYLTAQDRSLAVLKLQAEGQTDQAATLQEVIALQKQMGPLDDAHVAAIEASVEKLDDARKAQERLNTARQQDLAALSSIQEQLSGILGGTTSLASGAKGIFSSFKQLSGQQLFTQLFGDTFQTLRDQLSGSGVKGVTEDLKAAIAAVKPPTQDFQDSVEKAATAAANFASKINAAASGTSGSSYDLGGLTSSLSSSLAGDASNLIRNNPDLFPTLDTDSLPIVVNAAAKKIDSAGSNFLSATTLFNKTGKGIGSDIDKLVDPNGSFFSKLGSQLGSALQGYALGSTGGKGAGIVGSLSGLLKDGSILGTSGIGGSISGIASSISSALPTYALGQTIDTAVSPLLNAIGIKTSKTGQAIGGLLGSIIGGLFKSTKKGGATITSATGDATLSGNSSSLEATAGTLAQNVQSGLQSIASQLGGVLQNFSGITIGQYGSKYRVNTVSTKLGGSSSPVAGLTSYDSAEEAESAAIQAAVAKGAVSGLDAAVQKALGSSSNLDDALQEALQVKNVETIIGGIGGTLKSTFETFDATAKSNLAIAQKYGLDVTALEKATADQRVKLVQDTIKQSVGSLQDLLTELTSGDLADGDAATKRNAKLDQIAKTKALADTGDQDAIDALSGLYADLISTTKDAFGTAGDAYASDKATAVTGAQSVIQQETDRINDAAGLAQGTTDAVNANTDATNETNDLIAQTNAILRQLAASVGFTGGSSTTAVNLSTLVRSPTTSF